MIEFRCPCCGEPLQSPDSMVGQKESCPACGQQSVVPAAEKSKTEQLSPQSPTTKQLNYASKLGIRISPNMSRNELSDAISDAERKNPKLARQREHIRESKRIKECGPELIAAEAQWLNFSETVGYMLAVYDRGKNTVVDVLRVEDAFIHGKVKKKLKLTVSAPKRIKDRYIGEYLDWDRTFDLPFEKVRYHEPLHADFHDDGICVYQATVERGLDIAKKL